MFASGSFTWLRRPRLASLALTTQVEACHPLELLLARTPYRSGVFRRAAAGRKVASGSVTSPAPGFSEVLLLDRVVDLDRRTGVRERLAAVVSSWGIHLTRPAGRPPGTSHHKPASWPGAVGSSEYPQCPERRVGGGPTDARRVTPEQSRPTAPPPRNVQGALRWPSRRGRQDRLRRGSGVQVSQPPSR